METYQHGQWSLTIDDPHPDVPELSYCTLRYHGTREMSGYMPPEVMKQLLPFGKQTTAAPAAPPEPPEPIADIPLPLEPLVRLCEKTAVCAAPMGHEGPCDDIPF